MPDEFKNKAIEELAKQLPVKSAYDAPVQMLGALQDRYKDFLDKSVHRIPEENRLFPPPQILSPVLEALRYEPEGTALEELFSQLLSSSMDTEKVDSRVSGLYRDHQATLIGQSGIATCVDQRPTALPLPAGSRSNIFSISGTSTGVGRKTDKWS